MNHEKLIAELKALAADWLENDQHYVYGVTVLDVIAECEKDPVTVTDLDGDVWTLRENGKYSIKSPAGKVDLEHIRNNYGIKA